ncbi:MAG: YbjN domain-containing protein [Bacteroidales bacterium]|nr:YbjN domain-containing protein [Bacteroidales bacterium]
MENISKKEIVKNAFEALGYTLKEDEDGDLFLRYELKTVYVMGTEHDDDFISLLLPHTYSIDKDDDITAIMLVCNKLTRDFKVAKFFLDESLENVNVSCEFYYSDEQNLKNNIEHSLNMVGIASSRFRLMLETSKI